MTRPQTPAEQKSWLEENFGTVTIITHGPNKEYRRGWVEDVSVGENGRIHFFDEITNQGIVITNLFNQVVEAIAQGKVVSVKRPVRLDTESFEVSVLDRS